MNGTDQNDKTGLPGPVCLCAEPCDNCCQHTEKTYKKQGYRESIAAALQRFAAKERRLRPPKPVVINRPMRRGGRVRR